jgi:hypothetical protein
MSSITHHCSPYQLTIWGGGTAACLRKGEYALFWQGEEATDVVDFFAESGEVALDRLWDDYSDLATYEGTGPEPEED